MVKVRFAPSPTGYLHVGGARTALFNWMYARSQNGKFVLRVEDTDRERSEQKFLDEILDSMRWLGLHWDELYKQSERFDTYRELAQRLLDEGKAYRDGEAIILTMPRQEVKIFDLIRGEIQFDTEKIKDQVLMKSDGSPAYSFACVVDDALMEISHVIRGEDHISNTPKQIVIYQALGFKVPKFAHLPLILGADGARLSKRTGAVAVSDYREQGFLPGALVNYLMLLGWSPGNNQEVIAVDAAVKKFSIKKINKAAAAFSMEKFKWLNSQYIKQMTDQELLALLEPILRKKVANLENINGQSLENIVHLYKGRIETLEDFFRWTQYLFQDRVVIDSDMRDKYLSRDFSKEFLMLADQLDRLENYQADQIEKIFRELVVKLGIKAGELVHPIRVVLSGMSVGPGLFETMAVLGKEKTLRRLREAY